MERYCLMVTDSLFQVPKNFGNRQWWWLHMLWMYLMLWNCPLKMVSFILYIYYHNFFKGLKQKKKDVNWAYSFSLLTKAGPLLPSQKTLLMWILLLPAPQEVFSRFFIILHPDTKSLLDSGLFPEYWVLSNFHYLGCSLKLSSHSWVNTLPTGSLTHELSWPRNVFSRQNSDKCDSFFP